MSKRTYEDSSKDILIDTWDIMLSSRQTIIIESDMKVVLVTGGAGFIGSSVADKLLARGKRVHDI